MVLGLAVAVSLACVYDFRICLLWLYLFGVIHAAVTYFYGVSVEDFSELVIFREVLVY